MKNSQKGFIQPLVISITILALVIGGVGYLIYKNKKVEMLILDTEIKEKSTLPSVTVLSPNGGEIFKQGEIINGSYTTSNIAYGTSCNVYMLGNFNGTPVGDSHINGAMITISGKQEFLVNTTNALPTDYKIIVDCGGIEDQSDGYFIITTP